MFRRVHELPGISVQKGADATRVLGRLLDSILMYTSASLLTAAHGKNINSRLFFEVKRVHDGNAICVQDTDD
jgi:hypothetical protein